MKEELYFIRIIPDDYHGAPQMKIDENPGEHSTENEIFQIWREAGYNSYNMGDPEDFEDELTCFKEYANPGLYYSLYIMVISREENIDINQYLDNFNREISGIFYEEADTGFKRLSEDNFCEEIMERCPEIDLLIPY